MKFTRQQWLLFSCLILAGFALAVILNMFTSQTGESSDKLFSIVTALQPVLLGIIMTYLLLPFENNFERFLYKKINNLRISRVIAVLSSALVIFGLFFAFGYLILPELVRSLTALTSNFNEILNNFIADSTDFLQNLGLPAEAITEQWAKAGDNFLTWIQEDFMTTLSSITSGLYSVAKGALNLLIGIIIMIYLLFSRDRFLGQSKKLLFALCGNRNVCSIILKSLRDINKIFAGYLAGKVIDSLIIGVICFIGLTILSIPYTVIISVVIGITNFIPVFGPFIGAIPSAFILLLTDPTKCLVFLIFIIILQQVDGNIIGPKILGDSTGLPAFWVLFSLLLFQSLMGFWGLLLGVPLFASIYYLVKQLVNYLLEKKQLPINSDEYVNISEISPDGTPLYKDIHEKKTFLPNRNSKKKFFTNISQKKK